MSLKANALAPSVYYLHFSIIKIDIVTVVFLKKCYNTEWLPWKRKLKKNAPLSDLSSYLTELAFSCSSQFCIVVRLKIFLFLSEQLHD